MLPTFQKFRLYPTISQLHPSEVLARAINNTIFATSNDELFKQTSRREPRRLIKPL